MSGIKIFGRQPIEILTGLQALMAFLMVTPYVNTYVSPEFAAWFLTVTSAVFGVLEAFSVRPMTPALMAAAVRTVLTAAALFGVVVSEEFSLALVGLATYVWGKLTYNQVTPSADPAPGFVTGAVGNAHGRTTLRGTES